MEDSQVKPLVKSSDLRIGNLVDVLNESGYISPDTGYNWTVVEILRDGVVVEKGNKIMHRPYDLLSPITLTEDWLKRCGFQFIQDHKYGYWNKAGFYINNPDYYFEVADTAITTPLIYLHQLQNLVYVIENKELTIKEVI